VDSGGDGLLTSRAETHPKTFHALSRKAIFEVLRSIYHTLASILDSPVCWSSVGSPKMPSTPTVTNASCGISCIQSFNRLGSLLRAPDCPFQDQLSPSALSDELGRFRVWSGNIGALQEGSASLDYRLREASHVRQQVIKLLKDLDIALQEG